MINFTTDPVSPSNEKRQVRNHKIGRIIFNLANYSLLSMLALGFAFPIVFMIMISFKTDSLQVTRDLTSLKAFVPYGQLGLGNYAKVFERIDFLRYLFNTILIIGFELGLGLGLNSLAAYSLARLRWKGRQLVLTLVVVLIIIPPAALTIPLLQIVNWFGWFDSYQVIIVPNLVNPFHIYLFYQFFIGIPKDLDKAALIDGANYWQIYWRIILPLSRPVFATVAILIFLAGWSNYLWPLLTTHNPDYWPIMVGLSYFRQQQPAVPSQIMAFVSMVTIPVLIVFAFFQRYLSVSVVSPRTRE